MEFIEWKKLEFKKYDGQEKLRCPNCDTQRTNKRDKSLLINHSEGYGKCFYCEVLTFKETNKKDYSVKQYALPSQEWKNYTKLPSKFIKALEQRKIEQFAIKDLKLTVEK